MFLIYIHLAISLKSNIHHFYSSLLAMTSYDNFRLIKRQGLPVNKLVPATCFCGRWRNLEFTITIRPTFKLRLRKFGLLLINTNQYNWL